MRLTIKPHIAISADTDDTATGRDAALGILADAKLTPNESAEQLTEFVLESVLLNDLATAAELIYGMACLVTETSGIRRS